MLLVEPEPVDCSKSGRLANLRTPLPSASFVIVKSLASGPSSSQVMTSPSSSRAVKVAMASMSARATPASYSISS